jgi:protease YdgD
MPVILGPVRTIVILLGVLLCGAAHAEGEALPGIIGQDDRKSATEGFPWSSIGKVQIAGFDWRENCTGELIAPDLVLTAAHCFANYRTKKQAANNDVHFVLGLKRDKQIGHSKAKCVALFGPLPDRSNPVKAFMVGDAAVIRLDTPVEGAALELASDAAMEPGAEVSHAGYGMDRPYWPSIHSRCRVIWNKSVLAGTDCDTSFGQSGGPVLAEEDGKMKLAGIVIAFRERAETYVLPSSRIKQFLAQDPCPR